MPDLRGLITTTRAFDLVFRCRACGGEPVTVPAEVIIEAALDNATEAIEAQVVLAMSTHRCPERASA